MPNIKKMIIYQIYQLETEAKIDLRKFFENSSPEIIQAVYLEAGDFLLDIHSFKNELGTLLKATRRQVFLKSWCFEGSSLETIINCSMESEELVLDHCNIGDFFEGFGFITTGTCNLHHISLFGTAAKKEDLRLNEEKLGIFVKALSLSPVKHTLKTVHVKEIDFSAHDVAKIFDKHGFNLDVMGNDTEPTMID